MISWVKATKHNQQKQVETNGILSNSEASTQQRKQRIERGNIQQNERSTCELPIQQRVYSQNRTAMLKKKKPKQQQQKPANPVKEWAKDLIKQFTKENIRTVSRYVYQWLASLDIRETTTQTPYSWIKDGCPMKPLNISDASIRCNYSIMIHLNSKLTGLWPLLVLVL